MEFVLTIRDPKTVEGTAIGVSYDAFVDDVQVYFKSPSHNYSLRQSCHTCLMQPDMLIGDFDL